MAKEHLEVLQTSEKEIRVEYKQPKFIKKVFANFIDILLLVLMFIGFFIAAEKIVQATPFYKKADGIIITYREDSGMFEYSSKRNTWENISTWLDNNDDTDYPFRTNKCKEAIANFHVYLNNTINNPDPNGKFFELYDPELYQQVLKDYDDARLSEKMVDKLNQPLFVWNDTHTEIIDNPDTVANQQVYYDKFYREYTLVNCGGWLISIFPEYRDALTDLSNYLFFIQLPSSMVLAGFTVYLLPAFFFKRGRMTVGKFSCQIGLVDSKILSPSLGRFTARWAIFMFLELILSFFTFGLPFIISFTMMVFTKRHQGFPDYMLGLTEVDTNSQQIYYTRYEVAVNAAVDHKEPIKFKMKRGD